MEETSYKTKAGNASAAEDECFFVYAEDQAYYPPETMDDFSIDPIEFEEAAGTLTDDMNILFNMTASYNRRSPQFLNTSGKLLEILKDLAVCCITKAALEKKGIKCVAFNRLKPFAGVVMNNRDHRKILVIDGKVAFSGGINLADEYINIGSKYGHWKDNCIRVKGDAVWNYTVMFLTLWNASRKDHDDDFEKYKYKYKDTNVNKGFVVPYGENPLDGETTGEDIYLNIINNANDYVYIFTPYLIIDTDVIDALALASKRGVDVRIVIPEIPDKKTVYTVSGSYIEPLVNAGVKVYKYTPGFVHAKVFVSDDKRATVGTLNMDYRSLYLHFECGCYFEDHKVIEDIKKDTLETIEKSRLVNNDKKPGHVRSFWQSILRLFAPLM